MTEKKTVKAAKEVTPVSKSVTSFMSAEDFIIGCNERGSTAPRYKETAKECTPVPPFTTDGLAHLASLLSDQNTASGNPNITPDKSKVWSMDFLSRFNPEGHKKVKDASIFITDFARQVVAGKDQYNK